MRATRLGEALEAEGGVDQHQVGAEAGDGGEGVLGRRAAADHLVDVVPENNASSASLNNGCESASSTRAMTILSSERGSRRPSGRLLWLIRPSLPWYSRKSLYDSQRQLRIAEGVRGGAAHSPGR